MSRLLARLGTLRPLEVLLSVYEQGSISEAARLLHLTQPTVSMQMRKLAEAIDAPLYYLVGRNLEFTDAGLRAVETAREVLSSIEALESRLAAMNGLREGTLRLAVVTTAKYFIPHLIAEFMHRFPGVDVDFKVGNRQQIIQQMQEGREDFYVFSHPPSQDLILHDFVPNPLVAIAAADHPLAGSTRIPTEALQHYPFLMREQGSGTRFAIERYLQHHNLVLNVRMTIESNEAIKHAVMSGLGISILSSHTLTYGGSSGLAQLQVEGLPISTRWFLAQPKNRPLTPVAQAFLEYVDREGREQLLQQLQLLRL